MILRLTLEHTKQKNNIQRFDIWGISAAEVSAILQMDKNRIKKFISDQVEAKLPPKLYNFKVIEWEFADHRSERRPEMVWSDDALGG